MYFGFQNNNIIYILLIAIVAVMLNVKFTDLTSVSDYPACLTTDIKSFVNVETEKKLDIFPIRFFNQISPNRCLEECQDHGDCLSVNYDRMQFYCELLNQKERPAKPLIETVNYVYMELDDIVSIFFSICVPCPFHNYKDCVIFFSIISEWLTQWINLLPLSHKISVINRLACILCMFNGDRRGSRFSSRVRVCNV